jgi:TonB family protein
MPLPARFALALAACAAAVSLRAQTALVDPDPGQTTGTPPIVVSIEHLDGGRATVDDHGKRRLTSARDFGLIRFPIYRPKGYLDLSKLKIAFMAGQNTIFLGGTITSDADLADCFLALVVSSPSTTQPELICDWLPDLVAGHAVTIPDRKYRIEGNFDDSHGAYTVHIYSQGLELLTSAMKPADVAAARQKALDAILLAHDRDPAFAVRPSPPAYPAKLAGTGRAGSAMVRCAIGADGSVTSVAVVKATDPAFGEALADAARGWKFIPAVKDHKFIASSVEVPFQFRPPAPPAAGH